MKLMTWESVTTPFLMCSTHNGPHMNSRPDAAITAFRNEGNANWEEAYRISAMIRWPQKSSQTACPTRSFRTWTGCHRCLQWQVNPASGEQASGEQASGEQASGEQVSSQSCSSFSRGMRQMVEIISCIWMDLIWFPT